MAVVIRLRRMGAKKDPKFRIVVAESKSPRDGRFIEELGHYNPQPKVADLGVNADRAKYWLSVGALPSDRVARFLADAGLGEKPAIRETPQKSAPKAKAQERAKAAAAAAGEGEAAPAA